MIDKAQDKMVRGSKSKQGEIEYFFPDYSVTLSAATREEAEQKLAELLEAKKAEVK